VEGSTTRFRRRYRGRHPPYVPGVPLTKKHRIGVEAALTDAGRE